MGPTHPVHNQIFNNDDLRNRVWTSIRKKPFVLQVENLLNTWHLQINPRLEYINYPVIPPWFNLENVIEHNLLCPTKKDMGKDQNRQSVIETLIIKYSGYLQVYTDGSKSEDGRTGAAFYAPYNLTHSSWRLPNEACIASAELSAIHIASSWLLQTQTPGKVVILTDSDTSLHLISQRKPKNFIHSITKIQKNILQLLDKGWDLKIQWIPSHCGILGNETVDQLANTGRTLHNITYPVELSDLQNHIKKQMVQRWQVQWDYHRQNRTYGLLKPQISDWHWCRYANRSLDTLMTQMRLEKVGLNKYSYRVNLSSTRFCNRCGSGAIEDIQHYFFECNSYTLERARLFYNLRCIGLNQILLKDLLGGAEGDIEKLKRINYEVGQYIRKTKRFDIK